MAIRNVPSTRRPALAHLADTVVAGAFQESFGIFLEAAAKHHPRNRSYVYQFLGAWKAKLECAERSSPDTPAASRH